MALAAALVVISGARASATPYIPSNDSTVLQSVLPSADPRLQAIRTLNAELAAHPGDMALSLKLAARQLSMGVAESDPHFVGYAQGTLAPWWHDPAPPLKMRVLRARIRQAQHDFGAARQELEAVLAIDPKQADARLALAGIDETTGDLAAARTACTALQRLHPGLAANACAASVDSVSGQAQAASFGLELALSREASDDPVLQCWALTILAEINARQDDPGADQAFRDALAASPNDVYALTTYADYLLAQHRPAEVTRLLAGKERIDALLLRLALAAQDSGDARRDAYAADLDGRYEAARARGGALHFRDESIFELRMHHDPARALALARQNWVLQRTPLDARIYLAAALAAHDQPGIDTIRAWASATAIEDRALHGMLARQASRS